MKHTSATSLLALMCLSALTLTGVHAAGPPPEGKIRVLVLTGGHGFQEQPFYAMFDAMDDVTYTKAQLPAEADLLRPDLTDSFDVLVFYDMCRGFQPEQYAQFKALLNKGIGVVALHHTLVAHQDWPEYEKIIGGKYLFNPRTVGGQTQPGSTFKHDVDLSVKVAVTTHPITRGLPDFEIHDEAYKSFATDQEVQVLLTTDHPDSDPELAWVKTYGNSRVFYLRLGHDQNAYHNANYQTLLSRGIRWAACPPADPQAQMSGPGTYEKDRTNDE
jgi:type 1 glutamine amidotransferase